MFKNVRLLLIILLVYKTSGVALSNIASFTLASYYHDNMILQRGPNSAIIWGYANSRSIISTSILGSFSSTQAKSVSWSSQYIWTLKLRPVYTDKLINIVLTETIDSANTTNMLIIENVLFGDIWVCSGQSNMQMTLSSTLNGSEEIRNAHKYKKIRLLTLQRNNSATRLYDVIELAQKWSLPSETSLTSDAFWSHFSATCWYFGKQLHEKLNVPIGLISTNLAGTNIEQWSSRRVLKECNAINFSSTDSNLWNSMISPLFKLTIFGVIWYQGESNTDYQRDLYGCIFAKMIDDWRENWYESTNQATNPSFPFGFVQIANALLENVSVGDYPVLRWHQSADFGYAPNEKLQNVFMATAIDLVDSNQGDVALVIHPRDKTDVGYRLSLGALNLAYQNTNCEFYPPKVDSIVSYKNGWVIIRFASQFEPVEIEIKNKNGFEICCDDRACPVDALDSWIAVNDFSVFQGKLINFRLPSNCNVLKCVRYLWRLKPCEFKQCALYSKRVDLPIYPFIYSDIINLNINFVLNDSES